jgi:hypothetical protein
MIINNSSQNRSRFSGSELVPFNLRKELSEEELFSLVLLWHSLVDNGQEMPELDLAHSALEKILLCLPEKTLYDLEKKIDEII